MAIAHDSSTESHTGTTGSTSAASFTWSHTGGSGVRGALVFVHTNANADYISSVTYGGTAMERVAGGQGIDTTTEPCRTDFFFLGTAVATGTQNVVVNRTNNTTIMYAVCATVTATGNTTYAGVTAANNDQALAEVNIDDGSPGRGASLRYGAVFSGLASPPTAGANSTLLQSIDFGANGCAFVCETVAGNGSRPVGFSGTSDDVAAVYAAIIEAASQSQAPRSMHQYRLRRI